MYVLVAYGIAPLLWRHYEHHPVLAEAPRTASTAEGIPADALNVGFVGTDHDLVTALVQAGWYPADALSYQSSIRIAADVLLDRAYPDAPVSSLYLWGRKQDLAFEQAVGSSPDRRHHVRLWRSPQLGVDGKPFWIGAATFDQGVGFSHTTGQITHHIAPDIDAERDTLLADVTRVGRVARAYQVTGVGATLRGRNGGGDWYYTDGELSVAVLTAAGTPATTPDILPNPPAVAVKQRIWEWLRAALP